MKDIQQIETSKLKRHPNNPRKDYRDIDELAESIKARGVLQNLTVIPDPDEEGTYFVVIGNRRHMAAQQAGISKVPCVVTEMDERTQASTMLLENMQRDGLTVYEQANGFQMCLDLGMTEETIVEKTGFSKTTVHHRLNMAKLDQRLLKKKSNDEEFQLTLKDLYALEQVEDIKTRNKILREASNSRELIWKAQSAAAEVKKAKKTKQIIDMLKELGVEKAPKGAENEQWSGKWDLVKEFDLNKDVPKKIRLKETDKVYYVPYYSSLRVIKRSKNVKKADSPEEVKRKQRDKDKKTIKARLKEMNTSRKEFIQNIISGKIDALKNEDGVREELWKVLIEAQSGLWPSNMRNFFTGKADYDCSPEEKDEAQKQVDNLNFTHSMLVMLNYALVNIGDIYDWQGYYNSDRGKALLHAYDVLGLYGWTFQQDDDVQLLDGTHELYVKKPDDV